METNLLVLLAYSDIATAAAAATTTTTTTTTPNQTKKNRQIIQRHGNTGS